MTRLGDVGVQMRNSGCFLSKLDFGILLLVLFALTALYYPMVPKLVKIWVVNDNYSHGFFIPLVSLYMIYTMRLDLRQTPIGSSNWGIVILILGLLQLILATMGSEFFLQRSSIILVLCGILLFLFGKELTRKLLLPVLYLVFMIPVPTIIWNKIAFPMQLFSTNLTELAIRFFGIPVLREGNILYLMNTTLEVVAACSGLRSLMTMFALSAAIAWFAHVSTIKKWVLFFMAAPIAIFANIVRLVLTAALASHYGQDVAQGFLHEFSGMATFFLGMTMLTILKMVLGK